MRTDSAGKVYSSFPVFSLNSSKGNLVTASGCAVNGKPVTMCRDGINIWESTAIENEKNSVCFSAPIADVIRGVQAAGEWSKCRLFDFQTASELYLAYGAVFMIAAGAVLMLCETFKIWERKPVLKEKNVRITIPENLDYTSVFNDIFDKYAERYDMVKMKTTDMGSMFRVDYHIVMKDITKEKEMVDELRIRNGNLEVIVQRTDYTVSDL